MAAIMSRGGGGGGGGGRWVNATSNKAATYLYPP